MKELEGVCQVECQKSWNPSSSQEVFHDLVKELEQDYQNLEQHYRGVSLFIESLFRLSHFKKGHFVLRRRTTRVNSEIIQPQLQLYLGKLQEREIEIDTRAGVMPDEDLPISVDKGLMAQVYANLFSNAVKYTRRNGEGRKYMAYGRDLLTDYFGPGKDGVKFSVFSDRTSTSPRRICAHIFAEGYPGAANADGEVGTGRGLFLCATSWRDSRG